MENKQITIQIGKEQFIIKQTFRSLMLFEEKTARNVDSINETISDILILFWCILKGANKLTFNYSFDEFIDLVDSNQDSLQVFTDYLKDQAKDQPTDKKKVTKKV